MILQKPTRTLSLALILFKHLGNAQLLSIPSVPYDASSGSYDLSTLQEVIVDAQYAAAVNEDGETLIPPTLFQFAQTFVQDLSESAGVKVSLSNGTEASANSIFLTLDQTADNYLDAAGRPTSEGYSLNVSSDGITIAGASPLGAWWGTRTILQGTVLGNGSIPYGSGSDSPGWATRGAMLDAGRHYYPPDFVAEMCSFLSYFKMNTFHVHMSDNLYDNPDYTQQRREELYAAFRPNSPDPAVQGLNKRPNESYYESDLDYMQSSCASRGVTIVPEIEAPGHALVITQWKPELALSTDMSLLNISVPETTPTMEAVWNTFLPWFHTKTVHIGADEYSGPEEDYTSFINALSGYIGDTSNKSIRIWGTFPNATVNKNVSIQHWEFFEDNPYFDYIQNGYSVLNSDDAFYVVNKYSGSYPQTINISRIFNGNPSGGAYAPNIFDTSNSTNNPPRDNPLVLGEIPALWNDYGPNATAVLEVYYAWSDGLPGLANIQWGGNLTESSYLNTLPSLLPYIPGQNLARRIPSKTPTILHYDFSTGLNGTVASDLSGNQYDGTLNATCSTSQSALHLSPNCTLTTPLDSKGRNYTLTLRIQPLNSVPAALLTGRDSALWLGYEASTNVTFETGGNLYALNYSVPVGEWTTLKLVGRGNQTLLQANGGEEMEFLTKIGVNGEFFVWREMGIEAPLAMLGGGEGWEGLVEGILVEDGA